MDQKIEKFIFSFFLINVAIFLISPFTMHVRGDWEALSLAKLYYRGATGIGYAYNMFAPQISPNKYHLKFIVDYGGREEVVGWKRVVPQIYRHIYQTELKFRGGAYRGPVQSAPNLKKLVEKKFLSNGAKRVRAQLWEYRFKNLDSEKPLRSEKIVWSHEYGK